MTIPASPVGWHGPPPAEVCIVMLSAIGDAVHVLPVANALKRAWPDTRITWIIQPEPLPMVQGHPAIDDFIVFRRTRGARAWLAYQELMDELKGRQFDLLLGLQVYLKAGLITALVSARVKLGFDRVRARDAQWLFTNARIPPRGQRHVQDQYLEFVEYLGIDPEPVRWDLTLTEEERSAQRSFFDAIGRRVLAVVVGTSKESKDWSAEGYARVLERVAREHGLQPIIVGGPGPREAEVAEEVCRRSDASIMRELGDDLRRLMWLLDGSALLLSPDTGPLHIARAMGTPVVGLYGHTNPKRTGPYRAYQELIVDGYAEFPGEDYPVSPSYRDGMRRIEVPDVLAKIELALNRYVLL